VCIAGPDVVVIGNAMSFTPEQNPRLVGVAGPLKGKILPIRGEELVIGRDTGNDLSAADGAMSRRHCVVRWEDGCVTIRDLGARNGTLVNGSRIETKELQNHDRVALGTSVLVFLVNAGDFDQEASLVELAETEEFNVPPVVLRSEDAVYLQPERILATVPEEDRLTRDLNTLLKIANGIGSIRDREAMEWQLLGMVFDVVPADRAAILEIKSEEENFESAVAWDRVNGPKEPVRVSRTIVQRVLRERAGLMLNDVETNSSVSAAQTLVQAKVRSLLCVPIFEMGVPTGIIYLDRRDRA
jgi:phosphoserine phosphatase RsbU/P